MIYRESISRYGMTKLIGFVLFCVALGMMLMLAISNTFWGIVIIAVLLVVGYNLYFCK